MVGRLLNSMADKGERINLLLSFAIVVLILSVLLGGIGKGITAAIVVCIYMFPAYISQSRGHPQLRSITNLNFFLGWTFFGWVAALVWATSDFDPAKRKERITDLLQDPELKKNWKEFKSEMVNARNEWADTWENIKGTPMKKKKKGQ